MIAKWKAKAVVQKGISFLPYKEKINFLFQKYVTKGVFLNDEHFNYKITAARDHLKYFNKYSGKKPDQCSILELGTGWYPIIPIAMYLNDFRNVMSIDIQSWMTKESQLTTIKKFKEWRDDGRLSEFLPYINETKWGQLIALTEQKDTTSKEEICKTINFKTIIQDARDTDFSDYEIDFICSNNTLEHIPKSVLIGILKEFNRIIKTDGLMSHFIDMSDHFAHFDKTINIYNFLKYSEKKWNRIDNSIQPQNRLRFKDYKAIYKDLGIPISEEDYDEGNIDLVKEINLHQEYAEYTLEELAISHGFLISKYGER